MKTYGVLKTRGLVGQRFKTRRMEVPVGIESITCE
jgi:hypothetical protein